MAKQKMGYFCKECGNEHSRWSGQCSSCLSWNSLTEAPKAANGETKVSVAGRSVVARAVNASEVVAERFERMGTGLSELDRVLGGGLVQGSVVLIGGNPGIGKSTLLTQVMAYLGSERSVLYASGEESLSQISERAQRLDLSLKGLWLCASNELEEIHRLSTERSVEVLVVDSIQTMQSSAIEAAQGSVSQVRACCAQLVQFAKTENVTVFLVGHVTKEGAIAGPRVLEHMVDAVLYFEGEGHARFRAVRAIKNRFGSINELGVFAMVSSGLKQVSNPSALFLADRVSDSSGSIVTVTCEGTRPLLMEIQALADGNQHGAGRRVALGVDHQRLNLLLAVLHKHAHIQCADQDIFVNIPGGLKPQETSLDLPVLLAIASSVMGKAIDAKLAAFGEVGLSGEIRPISNGEMRIKEAQKQGFNKLLVPHSNQPKTSPPGIKVIGVKHLKEAVEAIRG